MVEEELKVVGICGIYCGTCPSYLAPRIGDAQQIKVVAERHGIMEEEVACDGCLSNKVMKTCRICLPGFRGCSAEHGVTWCFECAEFPCDRLARFRGAHMKDGISHHEHVIEDLTAMKERGIREWVKSQQEEAQCSQCGATNYWFARLCRQCSSTIR